jgi:hypothetical protein
MLAHQPQNALGATSPDGMGEAPARASSPSTSKLVDSNGDARRRGVHGVHPHLHGRGGAQRGIKTLNPDNSFLTNTKQGCKECSTPGKGKVARPRRSRARDAPPRWTPDQASPHGELLHGVLRHGQHRPDGAHRRLRRGVQPLHRYVCRPSRSASLGPRGSEGRFIPGQSVSEISHCLCPRDVDLCSLLIKG